MKEPTLIQQWCMVAQSRGYSPKRAFLEIPDEIGYVLSFASFKRDWYRVSSWRVTIAEAYA